jgi:biopolymer transport protein ExbD
MAFQLLAFFILTFRPPSSETRLDLYLPSAPVALPEAPGGRVQIPGLDEPDLESDLLVVAGADASGKLASLRLGETPIQDSADLERRLRRYLALMVEKPVRVRIVAPDSLRYEEAARLIAACSSAGVSSLKLGAETEKPR